MRLVALAAAPACTWRRGELEKEVVPYTPWCVMVVAMHLPIAMPRLVRRLARRLVEIEAVVQAKAYELGTDSGTETRGTPHTVIMALIIPHDSPTGASIIPGRIPLPHPRPRATAGGTHAFDRSRRAYICVLVELLLDNVVRRPPNRLGCNLKSDLKKIIVHFSMQCKGSTSSTPLPSDDPIRSP